MRWYWEIMYTGDDGEECNQFCTATLDQLVMVVRELEDAGYAYIEVHKIQEVA